MQSLVDVSCSGSEEATVAEGWARKNGRQCVHPSLCGGATQHGQQSAAGAGCPGDLDASLCYGVNVWLRRRCKGKAKIRYEDPVHPLESVQAEIKITSRQARRPAWSNIYSSSEYVQ